MTSIAARWTAPSFHGIARSARPSQFTQRLPPRPSRTPFRCVATTAPPSSSTTSKTTPTKPTTRSPARAYTSPTSRTAASTTSTPSSDRPPPTERNEAANPPQPQSLTEGLSDAPPVLDAADRQIDWTRSFHGLGATPFSADARQILLAPIDKDDVEVKPDGILYLPEIKYRRILNRAFGPGSWGLVPRGETIVTEKLVTREYALVVEGRLVSIARGEQAYFDTEGIPTATEGCKSNALMRCCKDIGIASELWDPRYIRRFVADNVREAWVEHVVNKKKRKISIRKDDAVRYPFKEVATPGAK